jgi:hypothetical protein
MLNKPLLVGGFTFLVAFAASSTFADVTMQQRISVEAGGVMSFMSSESTVTNSISNDKSRSETKTESKSKLMGSFGGNLDTTSIMRLDKDLAWQLNPEKQQYSEITFEQMRAQMEQSMEQLEEMQQSGGAGALPVSEEDCQWSDPKMDIKDTGEKQRFANVKAEQHIITVQETCTVPDSGQTCVLTWTMENWMARRMPGDDEAMAFNKILAEKLGTEDMMSGAQAASRPLMSMFKEGWEEALDEMSELDGYPVKTVMQMEIGGESCTATSGQPIAMDDIWNNALDAGIDAGAQTAGQHAGQKVAQEASEAMGDSVGGSVAGSAVGAASGEIIGGLLSKFGKRKKKPEPPPAPAAAPADANPASGSVVLFRVSNELTGLDDDSIPAERFEVPEGWKKVSRN